jgi:hypothetical protein
MLQIDIAQFIFPIIIWLAIAVFVLDAIASLARGIQKIKQLHQIPCANCLYFTGNYRLKCPIHPSEALTESAIHCRDFAIDI